jgi:hypothetical protein
VLVASLLLQQFALAAASPPLRSLDPPVLLPGGGEFLTWESSKPPQFSRTYYVDGSATNASDENPGTQLRPFKTINHAAQILRPGQRVLVAAGIYRERVAPARGGTGPDRMITYQAEPDAKVIIKGSRVIAPAWQPSTAEPVNAPQVVWMTKLNPSWFADGYDPFAVDNLTAAQFKKMPWAQPQQDNPVFHLPRGLVFQNGRRLRQVILPDELLAQAGTYWVDRINQTLHVRPFGDVAPNSAKWEITTRETVFAPRRENLGYIRVQGFTLEQVAGPWPFSQLGALSTMRGHHWIIEDNTIRQVNGAGMDIGRQKLEDYARVYGHHIVRRNHISDCGIVGICGFGPGDGKVSFGLLVEDNFIERCGWQDAENLHECGGIKLHCNNHCLVRRNLIVDTLHGPGIWMDAYNGYTRVCQNIILHSRGRGALFFEISFKPNLVDRNFIWDSSTFGILEADGNGQTFANNFIGDCHKGIELRGRQTDRVKAEDCGHHEVFNNIIVDCARPILERHNQSRIPSLLEGNMTNGVTARFDAEALRLAWRAMEPPPPTHPVNCITHDFFGRAVDPPHLIPGPFASWPRETNSVVFKRPESQYWQ